MATMTIRYAELIRDHNYYACAHACKQAHTPVLFDILTKYGAVCYMSWATLDWSKMAPAECRSCYWWFWWLFEIETIRTNATSALLLFVALANARADTAFRIWIIFRVSRYFYFDYFLHFQLAFCDSLQCKTVRWFMRLKNEQNVSFPWTLSRLIYAMCFDHPKWEHTNTSMSANSSKWRRRKCMRNVPDALPSTRFDELMWTFIDYAIVLWFSFAFSRF